MLRCNANDRRALCWVCTRRRIMRAPATRFVFGAALGMGTMLAYIALDPTPWRTVVFVLCAIAAVVICATSITKDPITGLDD